MDLAYDSDRWPKESLKAYLMDKSERDFGGFAGEIADIILTYSVSLTDEERLSRCLPLGVKRSFSTTRLSPWYISTSGWLRERS